MIKKVLRIILVSFAIGIVLFYIDSGTFYGNMYIISFILIVAGVLSMTRTQIMKEECRQFYPVTSFTGNDLLHRMEKSQGAKDEEIDLTKLNKHQFRLEVLIAGIITCLITFLIQQFF